jgi:hypothetical protein
MNTGSIVIPAAPLPTSAVVFGQSRRVLSGAALGTTRDGSAYLSFYNYQTSSAINNETAFDVVLDAGTYTFTWLGYSYLDAGVISFRLDSQAAAAFTTKDAYNAGAVFASHSATLTIPTRGRHTIYMKMESKNASSSAYMHYFTCAIFGRNA